MNDKRNAASNRSMGQFLGELGAALVVVAGLAVAGGAMLTALAGCETQPPYDPCELDKEVLEKKICTGSTEPGHDTSTCVVTAHPQCDQSICLSYFGAKPFCTSRCEQDSDCAGVATCWTYSDAENGKPAQKFCVPKTYINNTN
ncbi:MAG: hypothetical protein HY902_02465 [Deltaproteobacteria bacterium]|nr:hypothetical protein [Deltaproteobacteria bacterium]